MKKLLLLLALIASTTAFSQCVIDGTPVTGTTKAKTGKFCDVVVQSLSNGMVESSGDSLKTAVPGVHYSTPTTVDDSLENYVKKKDESGANSISSNSRTLYNLMGTTIAEWSGSMADLLIKATGNDLSTRAFTCLDSDLDNLFIVRNDGLVYVKSNILINYSSAPSSLTVAAQNGSSAATIISDNAGRGMLIAEQATPSGGYGLQLNIRTPGGVTTNNISSYSDNNSGILAPFKFSASNIGFNGEDFHSGDGVIYIENATTEPLSPSSSGSLLWSFNESLKTNSAIKVKNNDGVIYDTTVTYTDNTLVNKRFVDSATVKKAAAATALQTPRTINGTSFNGTADITVTAAAGTLTGSTLNNTVTASSLTSFGGSPTLTTPNIGVATATSINKVAITAPATSATLTLADGSTLATSGANAVTLTTTGTTNVTLPASGTLRSKEGMVTNPIFFTDFINSNGNAHAPYAGTAIVGGTAVISNTNYSANVFGTLKLQSTTTTNSGYRVGGSNSFLIIKGGEIFRSAVAFDAFANNTIRIGLHNATTDADAVNGIYFEITSSAIVLKTASSSTRTTSSTVYTASANTYYKFEIIVNSNATSVTGNIYDVTGVTLLGTQTITTNIPTTSTNPVNVDITATNSGILAVDICYVDYLYSEFTVTR